MKPDKANTQEHGNVDMSPEAIDQRLDMVSALYDLGKYLQAARPVEKSTDQTDNSLTQRRVFAFHHVGHFGDNVRV